jgi:hypothetical protein
MTALLVRMQQDRNKRRINAGAVKAALFLLVFGYFHQFYPFSNFLPFFRQDSQTPVVTLFVCQAAIGLFCVLGETQHENAKKTLFSHLLGLDPVRHPGTDAGGDYSLIMTYIYFAVSLLHPPCGQHAEFPQRGTPNYFALKATAAPF